MRYARSAKPLSGLTGFEDDASRMGGFLEFGLFAKLLNKLEKTEPVVCISKALEHDQAGFLTSPASRDLP